MSAPAITTVTGNLLWERTLVFPEWKEGATQRAISEEFQVGGKGINVSKMLNRLETPNTALLFAGGATGRECLTWLGKRGFSARSFESATPTRIGVVVRNSIGTETTFLGKDAQPGAAAVEACADYLDQHSGVLALCGSFPGWKESYFDSFRSALERWMKRGSVCVDTYGAPLEWFAARAVDLIKINRAELATLGEPSVKSTGDIASLIQSRPVKAWIVTDGPKPVWVADSKGARSLVPPHVKEVSATGSGDVLFASVLHARYAKGVDWEEATAFALPLAAANASHPGIAEFPIT